MTQALEQHQIPAELLTLEVTETTAMRDPEESVRILTELTSMGVKASIDDFGTGYSSLLYLKRLPASELKIDRAFVNELQAKSEDATIVSAIVALAQSLDLKVVAEGVETRISRRSSPGSAATPCRASCWANRCRQSASASCRTL